MARSGPSTPEEWLGGTTGVLIIAVLGMIAIAAVRQCNRRVWVKECRRLIDESSLFARRYPDTALAGAPTDELVSEIQRSWHLYDIVALIDIAGPPHFAPPAAAIRTRIIRLTTALAAQHGRVES